MDIINEEFVTVCGVLSMTLIGLSTSPEMSNSIGSLMKHAIQLMLFFNVMFIILNVCKALKLRMRKWQNQL